MLAYSVILPSNSYYAFAILVLFCVSLYFPGGCRQLYLITPVTILVGFFSPFLGGRLLRGFLSSCPVGLRNCFFSCNPFSLVLHFCLYFTVSSPFTMIAESRFFFRFFFFFAMTCFFYETYVPNAGQDLYIPIVEVCLCCLCRKAFFKLFFTALFCFLYAHLFSLYFRCGFCFSLCVFPLLGFPPSR